MVINYVKICWQIKYFLGKFYLGILRLELVWEFLGWKLIILTAFFCKIKIRLILWCHDDYMRQGAFLNISFEP